MGCLSYGCSSSVWPAILGRDVQLCGNICFWRKSLPFISSFPVPFQLFLSCRLHFQNIRSYLISIPGLLVLGFALPLLWGSPQPISPALQVPLDGSRTLQCSRHSAHSYGRETWKISVMDVFKLIHALSHVVPWSCVTLFAFL